MSYRPCSLNSLPAYLEQYCQAKMKVGEPSPDWSVTMCWGL